MTTKERVVTQSIRMIEKKLEKLNHLLNAKPLLSIIDIRIKANELLAEFPTIEARMSKDFMEKLEILATEERKQYALFKKTKNTSKIVDEKLEMERELMDLKNELWLIRSRQ